MQASLEASYSGQTGQVKSVYRTESNDFISPLQPQVASKAERREEAGEGRGTTFRFMFWLWFATVLSPFVMAHR